MVSDDRVRRVLIGAGQGVEGVVDPRAGYSVLVWLGGAVTGMGLFDLASLWFPPSFGVPAWDFGTLTATFEGLAPTAFGIALVGYALVRDPDTPLAVVRATSLGFGVLAAMLLVAGVLYARAVLVAFGEVPEHMVSALRRSSVRTSLEIVAYAGAYALMAGLLWRGLDDRLSVLSRAGRASRAVGAQGSGAGRMRTEPSEIGPNAT